MFLNRKSYVDYTVGRSFTGAVKRALSYPVTLTFQNAKEGVIKPVSYTHLDVYKRQTIGCAAALCEGLRALGRTAWICPHTEETHLLDYLWTNFLCSK